jgi:hypothetical protein
LRIDRVVDLIREVGLLRVPLEQLGEFDRRKTRGATHGARVLRGRLAVGSLRRGAHSGGGRILQHRGRIARGVRVVGELRRVRRRSFSPVAERMQHAPVEHDASMRAD